MQPKKQTTKRKKTPEVRVKKSKGHLTITVRGKQVFNGDRDAVTLWTLVDVLYALNLRADVSESEE